MKTLTILGALPQEKKDYEKYETIINVCSDFFYKINSPIDTKKFTWNDFERFQRAKKCIEDSDLIIWELSLPSTGQWIEIWMAYNLKTPIIILAKENSKISWLIKWNEFVEKIIFYSNFLDIEKDLYDYLNKKLWN